MSVSLPAATDEIKRCIKMTLISYSRNVWAWWPGRSSKPVCGRKTSAAVRFPRIPLCWLVSISASQFFVLAR
jgi:hypothetical protein